MAKMEQWRIDAEKHLAALPEEAKARRQDCLDSLWVFAQTMNPLYLYGDIHKECYQWLQEYTMHGDGADLAVSKMLLLPRAHLKSHIMATAVAWLITRHPTITIIYLTATLDLATDQLRDIQQILTSEQYSFFFPEYINPQEGKRSMWNTEAIIVDHMDRKRSGKRDATVKCASVGKSITGKHCDVVVFDDLVVPENAYTEGGRWDVLQAAAQCTSIRNPSGFTWAAGTRYHPDDIYDTWINSEFEVYDDNGDVLERRPTWEVKQHIVEKDGKFLWPRTKCPTTGHWEGFNMNVLARVKAGYMKDIDQFYAQYYNDPNAKGSERITRDKFQYVDPVAIIYKDGRWYVRGKPVNIYGSVDFAYTTRKESDYTAIVVIGIDADGMIYVLDITRFKTDKIAVMYDEIKALHGKWKFRKLRAEMTAAQSMIVEQLKDMIRKENMSLSLEGFRPTVKKEERIAAALEPRYENMQIWHIKGGYTLVLEEQVLQARPRHDDIKDALAAAVEIAKPPVENWSSSSGGGKVVRGRFGGVAFRRK